jgi:FkbH-like protein
MRRRSVQDIARLLSSDDCLTLQFRLFDRFGDNGLVSAMILQRVADSPEEMEIDTWVMSCRVFGRQLEFEAMNIAVEAARQAGVHVLTATYIATPKNGIVKDLFRTLGFSSSDETGPEPGGSTWFLPLTQAVTHVTCIRRQSEPT